jgi:hypothetical protein
MSFSNRFDGFLAAITPLLLFRESLLQLLQATMRLAKVEAQSLLMASVLLL